MGCLLVVIQGLITILLAQLGSLIYISCSNSNLGTEIDFYPSNFTLVQMEKLLYICFWKGEMKICTDIIIMASVPHPRGSCILEMGEMKGSLPMDSCNVVKLFQCLSKVIHALQNISKLSTNSNRECCLQSSFGAYPANACFDMMSTLNPTKVIL